MLNVVSTHKSRGRDEDRSPDAATISGRLVICREARNLTQAEAARLLGIKQQSLNGLERGRSKQPAADTLLDMRDRLGYDPDYVMRGKGMPLLPNFKDLAQESQLLSVFRDLDSSTRATVIRIVRDIRCAHRGSSKGAS